MPENGGGGSARLLEGLDQLTAADAAYAALVATRAPRPVAALAAGPVALRLVDDRRIASVLTVPARLGNCAAAFEFDGAALRAVFPEYAAGLDVAALPEDLQRALHEVAAVPFAAALMELGAPTSIVGDHGEEMPHALTLTPAEGADWSVRLLLSTAARTALIDALERLPLQPTRDEAAISVEIDALLRGPVVSLTALEALAHGDAILLPAGTTAERATLTTRTGGRPIAHGRIDGATATIEEVAVAPDERETATSETAPEPPAETGQPPTSIDGLDLRLSFSLGSCATDVATLRALAPGHVFTLDSPATADVIIRAEGREIGHGELVAVEDRLAVRVTRLWAPSPPAAPSVAAPPDLESATSEEGPDAAC